MRHLKDELLRWWFVDFTVPAPYYSVYYSVGYTCAYIFVPVATTRVTLSAFKCNDHWVKIRCCFFRSWGVGIRSTPFYLLRCTVLVSGTIGPHTWLQLVPLGSDSATSTFSNWSKTLSIYVHQLRISTFTSAKKKQRQPQMGVQPRERSNTGCSRSRSRSRSRSPRRPARKQDRYRDRHNRTSNWRRDDRGGDRWPDSGSSRDRDRNRDWLDRSRRRERANDSPRDDYPSHTHYRDPNSSSSSSRYREEAKASQWRPRRDRDRDRDRSDSSRRRLGSPPAAPATDTRQESRPAGGSHDKGNDSRKHDDSLPASGDGRQPPRATAKKSGSSGFKWKNEEVDPSRHASSRTGGAGAGLKTGSLTSAGPSKSSPPPSSSSTKTSGAKTTIATAPASGRPRTRPQPAEEMIVVHVNDRLGTKAAIPCFASDRIREFKIMVAARVGREPHEILLKRQGERPFKDVLTLQDYGISNGVQVDLEVDTGD